jgi:hypothetical protein
MVVGGGTGAATRRVSSTPKLVEVAANPQEEAAYGIHAAFTGGALAGAIASGAEIARGVEMCVLTGAVTFLAGASAVAADASSSATEDEFDHVAYLRKA